MHVVRFPVIQYSSIVKESLNMGHGSEKYNTEPQICIHFSILEIPHFSTSTCGNSGQLVLDLCSPLK